MSDDELMGLVQACRTSTELHERLRFAEEIVVRVGPLLGAFVSGRYPPQGVEDVVQEVLNDIGRGAHKFRGQSARQFWSWCYRIAARRVADGLRRKRPPPTVSLDIEEIRCAVEAMVAVEPVLKVDRERLEAAMALLAASKPPCVGYLTLHFIEGLDYRELAAAYATTPNAIRMQIQRCLALARQLVANQG